MSSVSLLEISGPIMVGPSSSHTAGALKLGQFARAFFGKISAPIKIFLHGSFGTVYKGHATDKAIVAGLLNFSTDSPEIVNAFEIAEQKNLQYEFFPCDLGIGLHPNTVRFEMQKNGEIFSLQGASVGGGAVLITQINDFEIQLKENMNGLFPVIFIHQDASGVVAALTAKLSSVSNSIASVYSVRTAKNGNALTVLEMEEAISTESLKQLQHEMPLVHSVFSLSS